MVVIEKTTSNSTKRKYCASVYLTERSVEDQLEREEMHAADLANMTSERDAAQDGLVIMSRLSTQPRIEQIADSSSSEEVQDAMDDARVSLEDIRNDMDEKTKQEMMFGIVGSRIGATSPFTIPRRSPATPGSTTPRRPRSLNWYMENVHSSSQNSNNSASLQITSLKQKIPENNRYLSTTKMIVY